MFLFQSVWNNLRSNRILNGIVVLTIAVGLLFPLAQGCIIENCFVNMNLCQYNEPEKMVVTSFHSSYLSPEQVQEMLLPMEEEIQKYGYISYSSASVVWENEMFSTGVSGCEGAYTELEGFRLLKGRRITEEEFSKGAKVCYLMEGSDIYDGGATLGDRIHILGQEYEIVGIAAMLKMYGSVVIPYACVAETLGKNNFQYRFSVQGKVPLDVQDIQRLMPSGVLFIELGQGESVNMPYIDSLWSLILKRARIMLLVLGVSLISICAVLLGRVSGQRYQIGVKLSLGAKKKTILREIWGENTLLVLLALVVDAVVFAFVNFASDGVMQYPSFFLFAVTFLFVSLLVGVAGLIIYIKIVGGKNTIKLLKR
ncbi:MAG: ABC transporter permease [Lachnospiraceae bacterium]|nr:ABC transporter permease [Lachnospiraceae bacterium]